LSLIWALSVLFAVVATVGFGAIPVLTEGQGAARVDSHVRIYILSNGFHSDIAIPRIYAESKLPIEPDDFPVNGDDMHYYAIGWGSKTAYTSLRTVSDLSLDIVVRALAFDETVIHVQPLGLLHASERVFAYDIDKDRLAMLLESISGYFASPEPLSDINHGFGDRYYPGQGRFAPWATCNSWTGRRLRVADIGVGLWTVTAQTLEFGLRHTAVDTVEAVNP